MKNTLFKIAFMALLFSSCGPSSPQSETEQTKKDNTSDVHQVDSFALVYHTPVKDTVYTVSTELKLITDGDRISGTYLWVLPFKDGKFGKITGRLSDDTVNGHYSYQQEGGHYTDSVQIILQADQAIVKQFNAPGHQLTDTLSRVKE